MQAQWTTDGVAPSVSPVSLIVTAFAPVDDVRQQLTPLLARENESEIWLIGLGAGKQRLGGSILAQCHPPFRFHRHRAARVHEAPCRTSTTRSACVRSSN